MEVWCAMVLLGCGIIPVSEPTVRFLAEL